MYILIFFLSVMPGVFQQSIYSFSFTSIEGGNKQLSSYHGKRILFITLPINQSNSNNSFLNSVDSLGAANSNSLVIIGIPSIEDGYTSGRKSQLTTWYRSKLNARVILSDGVYTRKTSGSLQSPLLNWLTDKNRNGHFNNDVIGIKQKFFITDTGELVGVLGSHVRLGSSTINSLLAP